MVKHNYISPNSSFLKKRAPVKLILYFPEDNCHCPGMQGRVPTIPTTREQGEDSASAQSYILLLTKGREILPAHPVFCFHRKSRLILSASWSPDLVHLLRWGQYGWNTQHSSSAKVVRVHYKVTIRWSSPVQHIVPFSINFQLVQDRGTSSYLTSTKLMPFQSKSKACGQNISFYKKPIRYFERQTKLQLSG